MYSGFDRSIFTSWFSVSDRHTESYSTGGPLMYAPFLPPTPMTLHLVPFAVHSPLPRYRLLRIEILINRRYTNTRGRRGRPTDTIVFGYFHFTERRCTDEISLRESVKAEENE